jgi:transposase
VVVQVRVQEVIPVNKSKAYRSVPVKQIELEKILSAHLRGESLDVGLDIGKAWIWAVVRCRRDGTYLRPWRAANPREIGLLVGLLVEMARRVKQLTVAMESSGTYGDPLRAALTDAGLDVRRVSAKASHDWSEAFDGVPSQHDGKDAAVVAELCAMGKSAAWPFAQGTELEQEMAYWVDRLDAAHRMHQLWCGRLESRLARHWPEVGGVLDLSSATLLKALLRWAGPAALAADPQAPATLRRLSYRRLEDQTIDRLVGEAQNSVGVRLTAWDERRMRADARQALSSHRAKRQAARRLKQLASRHELIGAAMAPVVGTATACVLWVCAGDPRDYDSGAAYRKAMGLNLTERSSGLYQGELRISKRGQSLARRFLYFAALRYLLKAGGEPAVRQWYARKKIRDGAENGGGLRGVVAIMRKLPLAIHATAARGEAFDASRLFNKAMSVARARVRKAKNPGRR